MLSFEEFRAVNNRDQLKASGPKDKKQVSTATPNTKVDNASRSSSIPDPSKIDERSNNSGSLPNTSTGVEKEAISRFSIGDFLELHSFQLFVIILIVLDTFAAFVEIVLHIHRLENVYATSLRGLQAFTMSISLLFSLEIFLIYFSFGLRSLGHLGYIIDFAVVFSQLYLDFKGYGRESRLLNIFRCWRAIRLFYAVVETERESQRETLKAMDILQNQIGQKDLEAENLRSEIAREQAARISVEGMLQNYKEEVDTLNEALKIAAMDIAEVAQDDDDADFEGNESAGLDDEDDLATLLSSRSGSKAERLRNLVIEASTEKPTPSTFLVHEDGKYEKR